MYRVVLLCSILVAVLGEDQTEKCQWLYRPEVFHCCRDKIMPLEHVMTTDELKECYRLPIWSNSCSREDCFGKKLGYYINGTTDFKVLIKLVDKVFEKDPKLASLIKSKCLEDNSDLSRYLIPDMCERSNMRNCYYMQLFKKCSNWNDRGGCNGAKQLVEECTEIGL